MNDNWRAIERAGHAAGLTGDSYGDYLNVALDILNEAMESEDRTFDSFDDEYFSFLQEHVFQHDRVIELLRRADVEAEFVERFHRGEVPATVLTGEASDFAAVQRVRPGGDGDARETDHPSSGQDQHGGRDPVNEKYDIELIGCDRVFRLHSDFELPLREVHEFVENASLPDAIAAVDITRRNNTLICRSVAADDSISKYTPTAQLQGSVMQCDTELNRGADTAGSDEVGTEYVAFRGDRRTVLQNSVLQNPMFEVLASLARQSKSGTLTAIVESNGGLEAIHIVDGEEQPVTIRIVKETDDVERYPRRTDRL